MIDFYLYKSIADYFQLILTLLFIVFLLVKFPFKSSNTVQYLVFFMFLKLGIDLYDMTCSNDRIIAVHYFLKIYRSILGILETGLIITFTLFILSIYRKVRLKRFQILLLCLLAIAFYPANLLFEKYLFSVPFSLLDMTKLLWIGVALLLFLFIAKKKSIRVFLVFIILWNGFWFVEVVLNYKPNLIQEYTSNALFLISEAMLIISLIYLLILFIKRPKSILAES